MQIYEMLYNVIATCMDLTLKVTSTFINETVKFTQIHPLHFMYFPISFYFHFYIRLSITRLT